MCRANIERLVDHINGHLNEPKLLSEWHSEINSNATKLNRLTERELAFAFKVIKCKNLFNVVKEQREYLFLSNESV